MYDDKKIWDDFREGESYALSHIYHKYIQFLYGYGRKISDNNALVKDSIQDLFFELIRSRENLGATDNIKFYLLASFRRKLISNLKKQNLFSFHIEEKDWQPEIIYSAEHDYIEQEKRTHREETIKKALQELSPRQREILYYKYTCGFDYEQICNIMSIKYDSARKQVCRALKVLKQVLSEQDIFTLFFFLLPSICHARTS